MINHKEIRETINELLVTTSLKNYTVTKQEYEFAYDIRNHERDLYQNLHKLIFNADVNWRKLKNEQDLPTYSPTWQDSMTEVQNYVLSNYNIFLLNGLDTSLKSKCLIADKLYKFSETVPSSFNIKNIMMEIKAELRELKINSILDD
jgi:hypothetical protein